jgi:hypothetical protein
MATYGLATLLGNYPIGYEFKDENEPLHLTHVNSFSINMDQYELENKLRDLLAHQEEVVTYALSDEFFGPNKDTLVTQLELNTELAKLHDAIMSMLESEGATFKWPFYLRDGYKPHVAVKTQRIKRGDKVVIKDISMATKLSDEEDAIHKILATFPLGKHD